jgi:hypothetical protein
MLAGRLIAPPRSSQLPTPQLAIRRAKQEPPICHIIGLKRARMSDITHSGELGIYIRSLRDRAATVRRLAQDITDKAAAQDLHKHAEELDRQAAELERNGPTL